MSRTEQITLARAYSKSGKGGVFEWGLGSSTFIADFLKVSRLCAVDSDPVWVQNGQTIPPWLTLKRILLACIELMDAFAWRAHVVHFCMRTVTLALLCMIFQGSNIMFY